MDKPGKTVGAPVGWIAVLSLSKVAVERGDIVPLAPVPERMRASIERMEQRHVTDAKGGV